MCYVCFLKNLYNTTLVRSSWFLLLNLKFIFSWILKSNFSWFLKLVDSILKSFSWAFYHHLCYHQNYLNQLDSSSWSLLLHILIDSLESLHQREFGFQSSQWRVVLASHCRERLTNIKGGMKWKKMEEKWSEIDWLEL